MTHREATFILQLEKCKGIKAQELNMYPTIQMFKTLIFVQTTFVHITSFYVTGRVPCLTDTVLRWSWWMSQWLNSPVSIIAFKGLAWPTNWDQDLSLQPHRNTSELWPLPATSTIDLRLCRVRTVNPSLALSRRPATFRKFLWLKETQLMMEFRQTDGPDESDPIEREVFEKKKQKTPHLLHK